MNLRSLPSLALFSLACLPATGLSAATIRAEANGSVPAASFPGEGVLVNGDFTITDTGGPSTLRTGDGRNEETRFTLDFNADPGFAGLVASGDPLASALLTLTVTPGDRGNVNDTVTLGGLAAVGAPELRTLPVLETTTIALDLLLVRAGYTSDAILADLGDDGTLGFLVRDDSLVSFASLELTTVPEPAGLALLAVAAAPVLLRRRPGR